MWRDDQRELTAFLLHSRPFQENTLLVELLTEEGKVPAVVYVSESKKSNKKALLQPFTPLNVTIRGQNQLKKMSKVEAAGKSYILTAEHLYSGFYLNELLVRLLPENIPCYELYLKYSDTLAALDSKAPIEVLLRQFEQALLQELGFSIDFSVVYQDNAQIYKYVAGEGLVPALSLDKGYPREHLIAIEQLDIEQPAVLQTYKRLMREVFAPLLGGKPLQSRKLFIKAKS